MKDESGAFVEIFLATSNEYKARAVQAALGRPVKHLLTQLRPHS